MAADKINPWSSLGDLIESDSQDELLEDAEETIDIFKQNVLTGSKKPVRKEKEQSVSQIKKDHQIHTYVRHDRRRDIFRCAHKYCYHMTDKTLLIGKANICRCGQEFILSREDLRRKWPRCASCSNSKQKELINKTKDISRKIFERMEEQERLKQIALSDLTIRREED